MHSLPKVSSETKNIPVGNGHYVSVFCIITVILNVHGHRFEIFTLHSEIPENVDLILGIKNIFQLEGTINSREIIL